MSVAVGYDEKERQSVVRRAKESTILDAAFHVIYYNRERRRYGPEPRPPEISISEIFDGREKERDVLNALTKAVALLGESYDLTNALYEGDGASSEQTMNRLKRYYPGFSDECYDMIWHRALRDAR